MPAQPAVNGHLSSTQVQTISNKCDRSELEAADNFGDHHCGADANNGPGFSFVSFVCFAKKYVRMTKIVNRMAVHGSLHKANDLYI